MSVQTSHLPLPWHTHFLRTQARCSELEQAVASSDAAAAAAANSSAIEISRLRTLATDLESRASVAESAHAVAKQEAEQLRSRCAELEVAARAGASAATAEEEVARLQTRCAELEQAALASSNASAASTASLQENIERLQARCRELEQAAAMSDAATAEAVATSAQLRQSVAELERRCAEVTSDNTHLRERIAELEARLAQAAATSSSSDEMKRLRNRCDELETLAASHKVGWSELIRLQHSFLSSTTLAFFLHFLFSMIRLHCVI